MKTLARFILRILTLPMAAWSQVLASDQKMFPYLFIGLSGGVATFLYFLKNTDGISHLLIVYLAATMAMMMAGAKAPHLVLLDQAKIASLRAGSNLERLNFGCYAALVVVPLLFIEIAALTLGLSALVPAVNAMSFVGKVGVACGGIAALGFILHRWVGDKPAAA